MRPATVKSSLIFNEPQYASLPKETILFFYSLGKKKWGGGVKKLVGGDYHPTSFRIEVAVVRTRHQVGAYTFLRVWRDGFHHTFAEWYAIPSVNSS